MEREELTDEQVEALLANYLESEELTDEQVEELVGDDTSWDEGAEAEPASGLLDDAPAIEPQPGDEGRTDTQQEYERSLSAAQTAYYEEKRSIHRLAYALLDLQKAFAERFDRPPSNRDLALELGVGLTEQRIGQLLAVAEFYPREQVDTRLDFKTYELARTWAKTQNVPKDFVKIGDNRTRMVSGEPRLALAKIREHPETKYFKDRLAAHNKAREKAREHTTHKVIITISAHPGYCEISCVIDGDKKRKLKPGDVDWLEPMAAELHKLAARTDARLVEMKAAAEVESQLSVGAGHRTWYREQLGDDAKRERFDKLVELGDHRGVKFGLHAGKDLETYFDETDEEYSTIADRKSAVKLRELIAAYVIDGDGYPDVIIERATALQRV
jgi:hypothetical protein